MYKAFSPSIIEEMEERGNIVITVKPGWEQTQPWSSKPSYISYWLGTHHERIFSCYVAQEKTAAVVQVTNMEATKLISDKKALVDAYMYITLKGLIEYAKSAEAERLIVDSYIPAAADHMLDLGFYITPKGSLAGGSRGCKTIKG